jgi:hypothetical protein
MAKLHELLAVEGNLKAQADKVTNDTMSVTFQNKKHHFVQKVVTYKPLAEGAPEVKEEQLDIQTTVPKEIAWLTQFLLKSLDASYQVDEGNTQARADVILEDGTTLLDQVPATCLLELEKRIQALHKFVQSIPTLDPAKGFRPDESMGVGVYKARDDVRPRTKKVLKYVQISPATDKYPAQVKDWTEDEITGYATVSEWSGLITTADKGRLIERVEDLQRAVKQARSRANSVDVDVLTKKIGLKLLKHVFSEYL